MKVLPIDKFSYTTFPITEKLEEKIISEDGIEEIVTKDVDKKGVIEITDAEYQGILAKTHCFNDGLTAVVSKTAEERQKEANEKLRLDKMLELNKLKAELASSDYQAIKYAEGLISMLDYMDIKAKRQKLREQINQIKGEIEKL